MRQASHKAANASLSDKLWEAAGDIIEQAQWVTQEIHRAQNFIGLTFQTI